MPLQETDNRIVKFNIVTGVLDPDTTPFYQSKKNNFQPRVSAHLFAHVAQDRAEGRRRHLRRPGTDGRPDSADRGRAHQHDAVERPVPGLSGRPGAIRPNFTNNPNNRSFQPRAYSNDYTLPEKVYQYTASLQQEIGGGMAASVAYVGSQGRNLFLRSIANQTIGVQSNGAAAGTQVREFDIVTCANGDERHRHLCPGSTIASIQRPYAEIDYKTSGGHDSYNAMQLALTPPVEQRRRR